MNKRIEELIEQADNLEILPDELNFSTDYLCDIDPRRVKKFAELIVGECMTVARKADGLDAEYEAWYLIKQHFGVEE